MRGTTAKLRIAICILAMAAIGVLAFAWWDLSWITIILLALGLGCLAAAFYTWMAVRGLEKSLDDPPRKRRGEGEWSER